MSRSERGFTLIELLVVIAIMAILAAILFHVFALHRRKGEHELAGSLSENLTADRKLEATPETGECQGEGFYELGFLVNHCAVQI